MGGTLRTLSTIDRTTMDRRDKATMIALDSSVSSRGLGRAMRTRSCGIASVRWSIERCGGVGGCVTLMLTTILILKVFAKYNGGNGGRARSRASRGTARSIGSTRGGARSDARDDARGRGITSARRLAARGKRRDSILTYPSMGNGLRIRNDGLISRGGGRIRLHKIDARNLT